MRWDLPRSIRVPNLKFLASPVPKIRLGARGGVPKLARGPRCIFYLIHTKFGVNIVEWSMLNTNVLDFRYIFALSNYGAICLRHGTKNGANFGFFGPRSFQGHLEEIGIAKVLLNTHFVWESFRMSVFRRLRKCGEIKKKQLQNIMVAPLSLSVQEGWLSPTERASAG